MNKYKIIPPFTKATVFGWLSRDLLVTVLSFEGFRGKDNLATYKCLCEKRDNLGLTNKDSVRWYYQKELNLNYKNEKTTNTIRNS